jgi:hypothetical protein
MIKPIKREKCHMLSAFPVLRDARGKSAELFTGSVDKLWISTGSSGKKANESLKIRRFAQEFVMACKSQIIKEFLYP